MRISGWSSDVCSSDLAKLVELAKEVGRIDDPIVRDRLTQIEGFVLSHRYSSYRIFSCAAAGEDAGAVPLMMKLLLTEIGHDMARSEEHTSELQSLMRISYAVFCLKTKKNRKQQKRHIRKQRR